MATFNPKNDFNPVSRDAIAAAFNDDAGPIQNRLSDEVRHERSVIVVAIANRERIAAQRRSI